MYPVMFEESMNTVLTMELVKFNRLLSTIKHALTETQRALVGITVMSPELEAMGNSMVRRLRGDNACRVECRVVCCVCVCVQVCVVLFTIRFYRTIQNDTHSTFSLFLSLLSLSLLSLTHVLSASPSLPGEWMGTGSVGKGCLPISQASCLLGGRPRGAPSILQRMG